MFKVGDLIIYSGQGICCIDDICEQTIFGTTKKYYILHPIVSPGLRISTLVENDKVVMLEIISPKEANEILETFRQPGIDWVELTSFRMQQYSQIVKNGNRNEIAKLATTLIRKMHEAEHNGKKLYEQDNNLLINIKKNLFSEIAIALDTSFEVINEKITNIVTENKEFSLVL